MKYFILFSCLVAVSYAAAPPEIIAKLIDKIKKVAAECKPEVGATDEDVANMKNQQIPTTTTGKCFIACIQKKLEFMTADGKFDKEVANKFLAKVKEFDGDMYAKFQRIADVCYAEVEELSDPCETATNMFACIDRERKAGGIATYEIK